MAGVDISKFANRADLANFKYYLVRQDIDKLKNVSYLSNLGSKVDTCTYWFKETKWCSKNGAVKTMYIYIYIYIFVFIYKYICNTQHLTNNKKHNHKAGTH